MESLKHTQQGSSPVSRLRRCHLHRRWWVTIAAVVAIVVILAVVIPLALILPSRGDRGEPSSVIFPLYIYPETNSTWAPLYDAISTHPHLQFLVVINPSSGPGNSSSPDEAYQTAIRQLDTYSNVQKVGYVRTNYAQRNVSQVLDDVATYAGWRLQSADLAMTGIFFDESPYQYASETAEYLERINAAVKSASGIGGKRTIIHNPGIIPDRRLVLNTSSITVVFEQSYDHYKNSQESVLNALAESTDRDSWAYVFHSVPQMSDSTMDSFVRGISRNAAYLYATTRATEYYEHFDARLEEFSSRIERNPTLTFLVIVNPNSGPGLPGQPSPDANYSQQIPRLNAYRNVLTIGYIRIDYCRKPLQGALAEIARYASWSEDYETTGLGVRGIFVDETPNHYSSQREEYLNSIRSYAKECPGILPERFIAHNPGTPPHTRLAQSADVTFVCEESYARFQSDEVQNWLASHPFDRDRAGYMISGVPVTELAQLVRELRTRAAWLFVTDVKENFYECFGGSWTDGTFMRALHG
ncbi:Spherulation-specific family 4 [Aspergillus desertorum]